MYIGQFPDLCLTENNFVMHVLSTVSRPLERKIDESVRMKYSEADIILNSGSEWRGDRDRVPRASFQAGTVKRMRGNSGRQGDR